MADKLKEVVNLWIIEYAAYRFWKEFEQKQIASKKWHAVITAVKEDHGKVTAKNPVVSRMLCVVFICELCKMLGSMENEECCISSGVLFTFENVMKLYPFSLVEKNHMRSTLKAQIVLSHLRVHGKEKAEELFNCLYPCNAQKQDEEYEDDLRELFQSENEKNYQEFMGKNTRVKFLKRMVEFMRPVWNSFGTPFLEEEADAIATKGNLRRLTSGFVQEIYLQADNTEDAEENWKKMLQRAPDDVLTRQPACQQKLQGKRKSLETNSESTPPKRFSPRKAQAESPSTKTNLESTPPKGFSPRRSQAKSVSPKTSSESTPTKGFSPRRSQAKSVSPKANSENTQPKRFSPRKAQAKSVSPMKTTTSKVTELLRTGTMAASKLKESTVALLKAGEAIQSNSCSSSVESNESSETNDDRSGPSVSTSFIPKTMSRPRWNDRQQNAKELEWSDDEDNEDVEVDIQHKKIVLPELKHRVLNVHLPKKTSSGRRRRRKFWSDGEVEMLEEGVQRFGMGNWTKILKHYDFKGRTSVNLKDKWRVILKSR